MTLIIYRLNGFSNFEKGKAKEKAAQLLSYKYLE